LQQTYQLQEKATSLQNNNPAFLSELGYELLLQGRAKDALKCYKNAYKLNDTYNTALYGDHHDILYSQQYFDVGLLFMVAWWHSG